MLATSTDEEEENYPVQFPSDLLRRHKAVNEKLKKFKRVLVKRFGPNVNDLTEEFNQLADDFKNASLLDYAGLSWQNAAECESMIENTDGEIEYLLKAARTYHEGDMKLENLCIRSNNKSLIECALQCYGKAMALMPDGSPMKLAVLREMQKLNPFIEMSSEFESPFNKIYELDRLAEVCVKTKNFVSALDKRTQICNSLTGRNVQHLYVDVLRRNEVSRILLWLLLDLPPLRQTESHKNLIEKCTEIPPDLRFAEELDMSMELFLCLRELVVTCKKIKKKKFSSTETVLDRLFEFKSLTTEHFLLLEELNKKFNQ